MLRTRVLTAAVLIPLVVLGTFFLPNPFFSALVGLVVLMGVWEWAHMSGRGDVGSKTKSVVVVLIIMAAGYAYRDIVGAPLLLVACLTWVVVSVILFRRRREAPLAWPDTARWLSGIWVLVPAWLALCLLQESAPQAVLMLFVLIWGADSAAYFTGRHWGRRKLAPAISPGKTLEGVGGALAAGGVVAVMFSWHWSLDWGRGFELTLSTLVIVLLSVFGDLFESNWKRLADLKDSGGLLPGHGGVLDRIDSITSAAPFFTLSWLWWFDSAAA